MNPILSPHRAESDFGAHRGHSGGRQGAREAIRHRLTSRRGEVHARVARLPILNASQLTLRDCGMRLAANSLSGLPLLWPRQAAGSTVLSVQCGASYSVETIEPNRNAADALFSWPAVLDQQTRTSELLIEPIPSSGESGVVYGRLFIVGLSFRNQQRNILPL